MAVCMTGYLYEVLMADGLYDFLMPSDKVEKIFRSFIYLRMIIFLFYEPYFKESRKLFKFALEALKKSIKFILLWFMIIIVFTSMGFSLLGGCNS